VIDPWPNPVVGQEFSIGEPSANPKNGYGSCRTNPYWGVGPGGNQDGLGFAFGLRGNLVLAQMLEGKPNPLAVGRPRGKERLVL